MLEASLTATSSEPQSQKHPVKHSLIPDFEKLCEIISIDGPQLQSTGLICHPQKITNILPSWQQTGWKAGYGSRCRTPAEEARRWALRTHRHRSQQGSKTQGREKQRNC